MSTKVHLLCIDPQNDFCDPAGALFVTGADKDISRLSKMMDRVWKKLDDIHITLDCHQYVHIAHPIFWIDSKGKHPAPFTLITVDDIESGAWRCTFPNYNKWALKYTKSLRDNNRYVLCIWPPHCLIGEKGNNVHPEFSASYRPWLEAGGVINFVSKGSNFLTEHYSAVKADVADPNDPTTQIQTGEGSVIHTLSEKADLIGITGQALSHCVNFTITDIADNFGEDNIKKFVLLEDTSSSVPGFEQNGDEFVQRMLKRGMQVMTSDKFLA